MTYFDAIFCHHVIFYAPESTLIVRAARYSVLSIMRLSHMLKLTKLAGNMTAFMILKAVMFPANFVNFSFI
jgi:hypothetical protein